MHGVTDLGKLKFYFSILLVVSIILVLPYLRAAESQTPFSNFKIEISILDFDSSTLTYRLQVFLDGIVDTPKMAVAQSEGPEKGSKFWPIFNVEYQRSENLTILTDQKVIEYTEIAGEFPHDKYFLTLFIAVDVDEMYYSTGRLRIPSTNYITSYNITFNDWHSLPQEIYPSFVDYGGKYLYRVDIAISHPSQFEEYAEIVAYQIPRIFWVIIGLLLIYLVAHTVIAYRKNKDLNMIPFLLICNGALLFLPVYFFSIRGLEEPLSVTPVDVHLMNLIKMFLLLLVLGVLVLIVYEAKRSVNKRYRPRRGKASQPVDPSSIPDI